MISRVERLRYAAAQAARVAFYGAHYAVARLVARDAFAGIDPQKHSFPSWGATFAGMRALFAADLANVDAGMYPLPLDVAKEIRRARESLLYLADIPTVAARRRRSGYKEVSRRAVGLPSYYRRNFHFQTDGYLSARSARLYDFQVEALFAGTASAMRRRAWVPLARYLGKRNPARFTLLDIGAGTGSFLDFVKTVQPALKVIALDLSAPYLETARRRLSGHRGARVLEGAAENMPLRDASIDAAVSIYLFHELPPRVRSAVAREIFRVLKPGGIFVLAETIQYGDIADCDGLIETFPELLHEPYYESFARCDLRSLFGRAGLSHMSTDIAYLTKISVFQKPKLTGSRRALSR